MPVRSMNADMASRPLLPLDGQPHDVPKPAQGPVETSPGSNATSQPPGIALQVKSLKVDRKEFLDHVETGASAGRIDVYSRHPCKPRRCPQGCGEKLTFGRRPRSQTRGHAGAIAHTRAGSSRRRVDESPKRRVVETLIVAVVHVGTRAGRRPSRLNPTRLRRISVLAAQAPFCPQNRFQSADLDRAPAGWPGSHVDLVDESISVGIFAVLSLATPGTAEFSA